MASSATGDRSSTQPSTARSCEMHLADAIPSFKTIDDGPLGFVALQSIGVVDEHILALSPVLADRSSKSWSSAHVETNTQASGNDRVAPAITEMPAVQPKKFLLCRSYLSLDNRAETKLEVSQSKDRIADYT